MVAPSSSSSRHQINGVAAIAPCWIPVRGECTQCRMARKSSMIRSVESVFMNCSDSERGARFLLLLQQQLPQWGRLGNPDRCRRWDHMCGPTEENGRIVDPASLRVTRSNVRTFGFRELETIVRSSGSICCFWKVLGRCRVASSTRYQQRRYVVQIIQLDGQVWIIASRLTTEKPGRSPVTWTFRLADLR